MGELSNNWGGGNPKNKNTFRLCLNPGPTTSSCDFRQVSFYSSFLIFKIDFPWLSSILPQSYLVFLEGIVLRILCEITHLIFTMSLSQRCYSYTLFISEETETERLNNLMNVT